MYDGYENIACKKDCGECSALTLLGSLGGEAVRNALSWHMGDMMFREVDVRPEEASAWSSQALKELTGQAPEPHAVKAVSASLLKTVNPSESCKTVFDFLYE